MDILPGGCVNATGRVAKKRISADFQSDFILNSCCNILIINQLHQLSRMPFALAQTMLIAL